MCARPLGWYAWVVIYLVRHGEAGSSQLDREGWWGPARDLAPLTAAGIEQARQVGRMLAGSAARHIIASPMTRALQTACLIAAETRLPLTAVEFDLREWLPDSTLSWRTFDEVRAAGADFARCGGEWPPGEIRTWEPRSSLLHRALGVLQRQVEADDEPFIAVCHGMVMEALTGERDIEFCGVRVIDDLQLIGQSGSAGDPPDQSALFRGW